MSGKGFDIHPEELHDGASKLGTFSDHITASLGRLRTTHQNLTSHAKSDRSGVGSVIVNAAGKSEEVLGEVAKEGARVVKGAEQRIHTGATAHTDNDEKHAGVFKGIKGKGATKPPTTAGSAGGTPKTGAGKGTGGGTPKGGAGGTPKGGAGTGSGGGGKPPAAPRPHSDLPPEPPLSGKKPPTASDQPSEVIKTDPQLPKPEKFKDPLPQADPNPGVPPKDKTRGAKVEQIDESRVKRGPDGLISHVDNKPVKQYVGEESAKRADALSKDSTGQVPRNSKKAGEGRCSALAIDLKTGLVTHGVNGRAGDVIPQQNLHPLLQQNLQDMRAWQHPVQPKAGATGDPIVHDGKAHYSEPAGHAEVKATNELLWQREAQLKPGETLPPSTLNELRFDPRWTAQTGPGEAGAIGAPAAACANCNSILGGVPSYTGRCEYDSHDGRYQNPSIPPHEDS
jgi:hypothetical protein